MSAGSKKLERPLVEEKWPRIRGKEDHHGLSLNVNDEIERDISPPMSHVITLPVIKDGRMTPCAVYVAWSPFDLNTPPEERVKLLKQVAERLDIRPRKVTDG